MEFEIKDAPSGGFQKPRLFRAVWPDSPLGRFATVWETDLWPEHLEDPAVRDAAEANVRTAYKAFERRRAGG